MYGSLSLRGEEFRIGEPGTARAKGDAPDVVTPEVGCQIAARCLGNSRAIAALRASVAHVFGAVQLDRRDDSEVIRQVQCALRSRRLEIWRRFRGRVIGESSSAGGQAGSASSSSSGAGSSSSAVPRRPRPAARTPTRALGASVAFDPLPPSAVPNASGLVAAGVGALAEKQPLSFYELVLQDELESGIAGITIEMQTPGGTATMTTDDSGLVRVSDVPPGTATARITSGAQELADALGPLVQQPKRRTSIPEDDRLLLITPAKFTTAVTFPDAQTQRVMLVTRTDLVWGSVADQWGDLVLLSEDTDPCRLVPADPACVLQLASTGAGAIATLGFPASGVDVGPELVNEQRAPQRLSIDIDALNEALFTEDFDSVTSVLDTAAADPPDPSSPPDFPPPIEEAAAFAAELALLALRGDFDSPISPDNEI
jgi:hypothetical protein